MARKTNVQLLQDAIAAGDLTKAAELAKKIKAVEKPAKVKGKKAEKPIIVVPAEVVEQPIDRQAAPARIRRVYANQGETVRSKTGAVGTKQMSIAPMLPRRMDGWKDTGNEERGDSVKTNPNLGAQRITERNRPAAEQVEAECSVCGNFNIISASQLGLSGSNYRCSKCCARRG